MYMIAGLCMLKLYQTRHPDINASAYAAYASFALVITLTVLGVVCPSPRPAALLGGFLLFVVFLDRRCTGLINHNPWPMTHSHHWSIHGIFVI